MTISFAGIPSRNAMRITPESPMSAPSGSKRVAMPYRSVCPSTITFWQSQMTAPAGMATVTALPRTKTVLSNTLRTITSPIFGRRYGGSSSTKADGTPRRRVLLNRKETRSVMLTASTISRNTKPPARSGLPLAKKKPERRISVGKRPLQGTKQFVRMAMSRSLGDSMMRQAVTPAALQPKPMHM